MEVASPISCSPPSSPRHPHSASSSLFKHSGRHSAPSPLPSLLARRSSKPDFYNSPSSLSSHGTSATPPLSRASSALSLFYGTQNQHRQQHSLGQAPPSPGPHASPSISMSTATATGTVRAPRKTPSAALPFVPLTPIMASPRLTPGVAAIAGERPRTSLAFEEGVYASQDGSSESHATSLESQVNDYLTCGGSTSDSFAISIPVSMVASLTASDAMGNAHLAPPPIWTSTPPTPPPKQSLEMCPPKSASRSSKDRSKSRSHSRARAATLAALTGARHSCSPSCARPVPSSSSLASSTTVTESTLPRGRTPKQLAHLAEGDKEKRGKSLPPSLSRLGESARYMTSSSTSGNAGCVAASPLRAVRSGLGVRRQGSRRLFHLGETEGSDGEGDEEEGGTSARARLIRRLSRKSSRSSRSSREMSMGDLADRKPRMALDLERHPIPIASSLPQVLLPSPLASLEMENGGRKEKEEATMAVMSEAEVERLRTAMRKYHALMELLATEAGYLMDLRALVSVYLEQLPILSTASPVSSSSPTLSIPSLGLARGISSRPSFLLSHPSPSTSISSHHDVTEQPTPEPDKDKQLEKSGERHKDREKHKEKHKGKSSEKENTKGQDGGKHRHKGKDKRADGAVHDAEENLKEESALGHEASRPTQPRSPSYHARKPTYLPTRRPILGEKDVAAICRNAHELLAFHDRFVSELREVTVGFGFGRAFEMGERREEAEVRFDGPEAVVALPTIDQAVAVVAEKFVTESSSFTVYEEFCPGHNEAVNLIRNVQENYPLEWDAYEQRCSLLIAHQFDITSPAPECHSDGHGFDGIPTSATVSTMKSSVVEGTRAKRRHSTSSLTLPFCPSHADTPKVSANRSEPAGGEHVRSRSGQEHSILSRQPSPQATRLRLLDYLIKPVQRVCKYPLLIDQLRTKRARTQSAVGPSTRAPRAVFARSFRTIIQDGGDVVERASEAMRLVVSLVNRASETQTRLVRSSLISSRMVFTHPIVGSSKDGHGPSSVASTTSTSQIGRTQDLTPEFVASLGAVRLAGALDVVQHPSAAHVVSAGSMRAKYFGAFLYSGGYIVLVKILKSGKVYEPRYWFSLGDFDLFDFEGDESSLPFSFHLCGHGHHLQLAAACQPEKAIWVSAIKDALNHEAPWTSEPPSSMSLNDTAQSVPPVDDEPLECASAPLPTIQSNSELERQAMDQWAEPATLTRPRLDLKPRSPSRIDSISFRQEQQAQMASFAALSRRSSTASVKAFFSPMTLDPSTRIPRPSAQVRHQVDHGLHDVFSEQCLAARSNATMRHEDLFKRPSSHMSRSNSGLSLSNAMGLASKRRYDMTPSKRMSLDGGKDHEVDFGNRRLSTLPGAMKSSASPHKRSKKPLPSLVPAVPSNLTKVNSEAEMEGQTTQSPTALSDSPLPPSQCSSTASSILPSPVDAVGPIVDDIAQDATLRPSDVLTTLGEDWRPKRTRSMVDNVKYFFHSRPSSPSSTSSHQSATPPQPPPKQLEMEVQMPPPAGITQWWRKGSLRRRVQSSPDVPGDEGPPPLLSRASVDGRATFLMQTPEEPMLQSSASSPPSPVTLDSRREAASGSVPTRRRSLFAPSTRQRDSPLHHPSPDGPGIVSRRSLRNVWFFQRTNSFTPLEVKEPVS